MPTRHNIEEKPEESDMINKDNSDSDIKTPAFVDFERTEIGSGENPILQSQFKVDKFEINEDSIYKRLVYHKIKSSEDKFLAHESATRYKIKKIIGEGATGGGFATRDYNF